MDFKTGKIIEIVREFLANSENKFEINGVDLSKAVFMYRQKNTSFEPIPKGNYTTKEESNILYLKVDDEIKAKAYEYQIIYTTDMKAGKYLETYPELKVLVAKYNDLVEDVTNIIKYAKTTGVKVDTVKMTQILTPLEPNTFWAMNEKGNIETYPLGNLNSKYETMVSTLKKEVEELIKTTKETSISEINSSANLKLSEFAKELEKKNNDLNAIFEQAKEAIKNSIDTLNINEANAIREFERILTERINSLNQVTEDLKNDLANAVARYIEANRERLKGDKGDGITAIEQTGETTLKISYGAQSTNVTIPRANSIKNLKYENSNLILELTDGTNKQVEINSMKVQTVFQGSLNGENIKICDLPAGWKVAFITIGDMSSGILGDTSPFQLFVTNTGTRIYLGQGYNPIFRVFDDELYLTRPNRYSTTRVEVLI